MDDNDVRGVWEQREWKRQVREPLNEVSGEVSAAGMMWALA